MGSKLFSPIRLRGLEIPNRIMVSPMGQYSATNGTPGAWHQQHLGHLAMSGAGLLCIEATAISPNARLSPRDLGLWSDENEAALRPIIEFCKSVGGSRIGQQLWHVGRKGSVTVAWERQLAIPIDKGGWEIYGASPIPYPKRNTPVALTRAMMDEVIADYVATTKRCDRLGVELLELHGAHGYLLHEFLSPLANHRTDAYGGPFAHRTRLMLEVVAAVREVWPEHLPLLVRLSATDWVEGGWSVEETVELARLLRTSGVDLIDTSSGGLSPEQQIPVGPGYQVPFARRVRHEAGIATGAVGLITDPAQAEAIVRDGDADLVLMARELLRNPRWPLAAAKALGVDGPWPRQYERARR